MLAASSSWRRRGNTLPESLWKDTQPGFPFPFQTSNL